MDKTYELLQGLAKYYDYTVDVTSQGVRLIGNGGPVFEFKTIEDALSEFNELLKEDEGKPENWQEALMHIEQIQIA